MLKLFIVNESKGLTLGNIRITILTMIIFLVTASLGVITHPVNIAGMLILIALISSLFLGKLIIRWMFYLMALVFLGGVIVVLLFMVSVCANEKFFFKNRRTPAVGVGVWVLARLLLNKTTIITEAISGISLPLVLYQREGIFSFIIFMGVLVLCIIRVVKIRKLESGPMVKRL